MSRLSELISRDNLDTLHQLQKAQRDAGISLEGAVFGSSLSLLPEYKLPFVRRGIQNTLKADVSDFNVKNNPEK